MSRLTTTFSPARARQGSIFILVISILAVLILLTLTLSYMTKMDLLASRNWANTVQARMAAVTGVPLYTAGEAKVITPASLTLASTTLSNATLNGEMNTRGKLEPVALRLTPENKYRKSLLTSHLQLMRTASAGTTQKNTKTAANTGANSTPVSFLDAADALAEMLVEDESAKININALVPAAEQHTAVTLEQGTKSKELKTGFLSEDMLARFISTTFEAQQIHDVDARQLAHAIAQRRFGADGRIEPAKTVDTASLLAGSQQTLRSATRTRLLDRRTSRTQQSLYMRQGSLLSQQGASWTVSDPGQQASDPRQCAQGDDRPFTSVEELLAIPGMTWPAYQALAPYLTTLSVSFAAFDMTDARNNTTTQKEELGFPQVDPNTASAEVMYDVLKRRFPQAPEGLLGQFVANIIDRCDEDDVPTPVRLSSGTYYGQEVNPCLNEVCPQVSFTGNNQGAYIELCNPYTNSLSLEGWSIQGAGTVKLKGSLPSGGYLVLTDDFNNDKEEDSKASQEDTDGEGSFYNVFGVVAVGGQRQIQECPQLKVPNSSGHIKLLNAQGQVVDEFEYANHRFMGKPIKSFQRKDPRLRSTEEAEATPLKPNRGVNLNEDATRVLRIQEQWKNQPFRSALDLMLVSSAYAQSSTSLQSGVTHPFALPDMTASDTNNLDLRLVDCFRVGAQLPEAQSEQEQEQELLRQQATLASMTAQQRNTRGLDLAVTTPRCDVVYGRLNLNTAPLATLAALPGMDQTLLARLAKSRNQIYSDAADAQLAKAPTSQDREWWAAFDPFAQPRWRNLSDFLLDESIWEGRPLYDRLDASYPFIQLVTTHSIAVRMVTANRLPELAANDQTTRRPSVIRAERIVAGDRGSMETVSFRFLGLRTNSAPVDADLLYAAPASKAHPLDMAKVLSSGRVKTRKATVSNPSAF